MRPLGLCDLLVLRILVWGSGFLSRRGVTFNLQDDPVVKKITFDCQCGMRSVMDLSIIEEGIKVKCPECFRAL